MVWMGLVLGPIPWAILLLLSMLQGVTQYWFSGAATGIHVRLLVAIPLFFVCETWVVPRIAEFARYVVATGLVKAPDISALNQEIRGVVGLANSPRAEAVCLVVALALPLLEPLAKIPGSTGNWTTVLNAMGGRLTWASGWYLVVCLPLMRFLMLRWLWKLWIWWYFLWRLQKLDLDLIAIHSDWLGRSGLSGKLFRSNSFHWPLLSQLFCPRTLQRRSGLEMRLSMAFIHLSPWMYS